jgi:hypothetical protein
MKILKRESLRVVVPIVRLRNVLRYELVRQMAVDALRGAVMRPLDPGVVLVVHDVAVGTGPRVGREITQPLSVMKRERPDSCRQSRQDRQKSKQSSCVEHVVIFGLREGKWKLDESCNSKPKTEI